MTDLIGHNNPPIETAADLPSGMPKMHYFKCDIAAARKATFDKPLDVRGAFWSAMLAMYEYMEPLPADDSMAQMRLGIKDVRTYRAVKKIMLNLGMLYQLPSGRLSNQRFEDEIAAYVTEFRNRQEAAKIREEKARVARGTRGNRPGIDRESTSNRPRIDLKSPANRPPIEDRLNVDLSKKTNENKGDATTIVPEHTPQTDHEAPLRARVLELELDSKGKKEREYAPPHTTRMPRRDDRDLPPVDVWVCRPGEEEIQPGLFVNCNMIRHRGFTVSIDSVAMQLATASIGIPKEDVPTIARNESIAQAMQWAADYDAGRQSNIPTNTANYVRGVVIAAQNKKAAHTNSMSKSTPYRPSSYGREKPDPQAAALDALEEVNRRKEAKKAQAGFIDGTFTRIDR